MAFTIIRAKDGGYTAGGSVDLQDGFASPAPWIAHLGSDGSPLSQMVYSTPTSLEVLRLVPLSDGGLLAAARPTSYDFHFSLMRLDPTGQVQWVKQYGAVGYYSEVLDVAVAPGGGFFVLGTTSRLYPPTTRDVWLLKTRPDGSIPADCPLPFEEITGVTAQTGTPQFEPLSFTSQEAGFTVTDQSPTVSSPDVSVQTHCQA